MELKLISEKRKNHNYIIYKKYTIKEIFNYLNNNELPDKIIYNDLDYKDSIKRCLIIKELLDRDGYKCKNCNLKPYYFALGKDKTNRWHLDLYSKDDHMFTIDHIYPKSKGGENNIDNYQLLCKICNEDKSDVIIGEEIKIIKKNYLYKKFTSLSEQINGILSKIKDKEIVCINNVKNFTIGKQYDILDIKLYIDKNFKTKFKITTKNDIDNIVSINFHNFMTKVDFFNRTNTKK